MCSTYLGLLLGSIIGSGVSLLVTPDQLVAWGWRIPFLLSGLFGVAALILRLHCTESPLFIQAMQRNQLVSQPIKMSFSQYPRQIFSVILVSSALAVAIYLLIGYLPAYFVSTLHMTIKHSMFISFIGLLVLTLCVPIMGVLSDKVSKKWILGFGVAILCFFAYPIFYFSSLSPLFFSILSEILLVIGLAPIAGTIISIMSDYFPTSVRYTGISVGYNISMSIFGGLTPLIAMYLSHRMGSSIAPAYYLIMCCVITLLGLLLLNRHDNYLSRVLESAG